MRWPAALPRARATGCIELLGDSGPRPYSPSIVRIIIISRDTNTCYTARDHFAPRPTAARDNDHSRSRSCMALTTIYQHIASHTLMDTRSHFRCPACPATLSLTNSMTISALFSSAQHGSHGHRLLAYALASTRSRMARAQGIIVITGRMEGSQTAIPLPLSPQHSTHHIRRTNWAARTAVLHVRRLLLRWPPGARPRRSNAL